MDNIETRVGYMAVSVLKDIAEEHIKIAYLAKDYVALVDLIQKYRDCERYLN